MREFAAMVGTEERLKLLCLMTLADVEAVSPDTLTRWKEELLWRLYVDTYNYLTLQYGDDLIERTQAAVADCVARRPGDLAAGEVAAFLEGLPRRYLQLFERRAIYQHVRLARNIHPDEVHLRLEPADAAWQLTVVTLDKPMLFANICGVLSSFGMPSRTSSPGDPPPPIACGGGGPGCCAAAPGMPRRSSTPTARRRDGTRCSKLSRPTSSACCIESAGRSRPRTAPSIWS